MKQRSSCRSSAICAASSGTCSVNDTADGDRQQILSDIRAEYARRTERWNEFDEARRQANATLLEYTLRAYDRLLSRNGLLPLGDRSVLDVGCGRNEVLVACRERWGQTAPELCGIDLLSERVAAGVRDAPYLRLVAGSADRLPWGDEQFDLVHQAMLLTSIVDAEFRRRIVAEMCRVTRPGGWVLWYDFVWNPTNRAAQGIGLQAMRAYFGDWRLVDRQRVTVAPPLARLLSRVWAPLVGVVERCRVLNFWELALLRKPG